MIISKILQKVTHNDTPDALSWWLKRQLNRLHLVTREEFDIQQAVLLKTRQKLEDLEKELLRLNKISCSTNKPVND